jgi:hypothetical protein
MKWGLVSRQALGDGWWLYAVFFLLTGSQARAYTRPLLSSTYAVVVSEPQPCCVKFETSYDPSIYWNVPNVSHKKCLC